MFCPACGADLDDVNAYAHLVVCPQCDSTLLLDENAARVAGEMSVLPPPRSPLFVGATGQVLGHDFHVIGRVRYGYAQGYWDEWFLACTSGDVLWLSEDEENLTLESFSQTEEVSFQYADVTPGDFVTLGETSFHVDEKGVAICEGAEGQLPFEVEHGEKTPYLDLNADDAFATVEWELSGETRVFRGRRLDWSELQLDLSRSEAGVADNLAVASAGESIRERIVRDPSSVRRLTCYACGAALPVPESGDERLQCPFCEAEVDLHLRPVDCPACAATLPLHGGEAAKSVVCAHCHSQVDLSHEEPSVIGKIADGDRPWLPIVLGQRVQLRGNEYQFVGRIRYRLYDEGFYYWDELLLHSREAEYMWLSYDDGHWSISEEIHDRPQTIRPRFARRKQSFTFLGKRWKVFERYSQGTQIDYVEGELPWVAQVGDECGYMDAISPPWMLSAEWTDTEMEWYRSEYLPREKAAEALGVETSKLPRSIGVAPHQPYPAGPFRRQAMWIMAGVAVMNLILAMLCFASKGKEIAKFHISPTQYQQEFITSEFHATRNGAVYWAEFESPVNNAWVYLDVAVLDEQDQALLDYSAEISYYHGVEGGERWSEGSQSRGVPFRLEKQGAYRLLVAGQAGYGETGTGYSGARPVTITIYEGVRLARFHLFLGIIALMWAGIEGTIRLLFETRRWGEED